MDFHRVVEPIVNQARENIQQITNKQDAPDGPSFHLAHSHKVMRAQVEQWLLVTQGNEGTGRAVVTSDTR
jgi:hypothetical protein